MQQGTSQRVRWDPNQRAGEVLDTIPFDGEEWSRVQSDGWHERLDMPGFYQREAVPGLTKPCDLVIRSRDLKPVEPAPEKTAPEGLKGDISEALEIVRDMQMRGDGRGGLVALERLLQGIQAQVAG